MQTSKLLQYWPSHEKEAKQLQNSIQISLSDSRNFPDISMDKINVDIGFFHLVQVMMTIWLQSKGCRGEDQITCYTILLFPRSTKQNSNIESKWKKEENSTYFSLNRGSTIFAQYQPPVILCTYSRQISSGVDIPLFADTLQLCCLVYLQILDHAINTSQNQNSSISRVYT